MAAKSMLFPIATPPPSNMASSGASPALADRLATACYHGDLPSAKAAVADGASVNAKGKAPVPGWDKRLPLVAAARQKHNDVVVWLLSHGADPNGNGVMYLAGDSTAAILQLLIDAGGDVSNSLLFSVIETYNAEDNVRVLLAQPCLDLTMKCAGLTPEQYADHQDTPAVADMIAQEVSRKRLPILIGGAAACVVLTVCGVAVAGRSRDERRWCGHCFARLVVHVHVLWCGHG